MKIQILTLVTLFAAAVNATTTSQTIKPTFVIPAPPGVVCALAVCPTSSLAKRDTIACPVICPNNCQIVDDVCCPGQKKAVCNNVSHSTSVATATGTNATSVAVPTTTTSAALNSSSVAVPSATSSVVSSASINESSSVAAAAAAAATTLSSDATASYAVVLSTCMLVTLLTIGLNQL